MAGESARDVAARSRAKAERLLRNAEMYERGADGEVQTASVLAALPPEWVSLHDLRWPGRQRANIDHIVLGPGGIFVIDTKNWSGRLDVDKDALRQNGRSRETAVAACADSALAVAERMGVFARHVHPVLCFARDEPISGWAREVMICSTSNLTQMLMSRPAALTQSELPQAWTMLQVELKSASVSPVHRTARRSRAGGTAARPKNTGGSRRRRRSKDPSLGRLLMGLVMAGAMLLWGPQLATAFGALVSHQITTAVENGRPCPAQPHASSTTPNHGATTGHQARTGGPC